MVEDDAKDVELTMTALEGHNLANEVIVTRDGEEALDYLYRRGKYTARSSDHPAVILLDLKLPKIDGLEVLRQVKSDDDLKDSLLAVELSSTLKKKFGIRRIAYVVKPVDFHEFVNAIRELGVFWAIINAAPPGSVRK